MAYISSFTYCDSIQMEMTPQGSRNQIVKPFASFSADCDTGKLFFCDCL